MLLAYTPGVRPHLACLGARPHLACLGVRPHLGDLACPGVRPHLVLSILVHTSAF